MLSAMPPLHCRLRRSTAQSYTNSHLSVGCVQFQFLFTGPFAHRLGGSVADWSESHQQVAGSYLVFFAVLPSATLGKLFIRMCLCHQALWFGTVQWTVTIGGLGANRGLAEINGSLPPGTLRSFPYCRLGHVPYLYVCPVRDRKLRTGVGTWKFSARKHIAWPWHYLQVERSNVKVMRC